MADELKGKGKHLGGKIKEELGEALGDRKMRREGQLSQVEGESEQDEVRAAEAARAAQIRKERARVAKEEPGLSEVEELSESEELGGTDRRPPAA